MMEAEYECVMRIKSVQLVPDDTISSAPPAVSVSCSCLTRPPSAPSLSLCVSLSASLLKRQNSPGYGPKPGQSLSGGQWCGQDAVASVQLIGQSFSGSLKHCKYVIPKLSILDLQLKDVQTVVPDANVRGTRPQRCRNLV